MIDADLATKHPREFFGQQGVVRKIFSRIGAERPQSVAVIGGRKTGKTSLLNYLAHPEVLAEYLPDFATKYRLGLISVKDEATMTVDHFIGMLNDLLETDLREGETGYARLQRAVEDAHAAGRHIVFFFDDFHNITRNTNFPLEFFSFLRSLANNFNVAYVTTSHLELQKLCVAKDIEESPFFNIFTNIALGLLSSGEATNLLSGLTGWGNGIAERVIAWAGPHPYLVKIIARECGTQPPPEGQYDRLFLPLFKKYFAEIIAVLPPEAFRPLKELAKGKGADPRDAHYLKPLVRHRFLVEEEDTISFFSDAFRQFVQNDVASMMLKGDDCRNRD